MSVFRHLKYALQPLRRSFTSCKSLTDVHPTVQNALRNKQPIVALESTIITHGMPFPQNLETALEVEEIVRLQGATPATIAILNGRIKVGLNSQDLKQLASTDPKSVIKCSRRDLPFVIGNSLSGGTTVAGTMIIANMVGIRIFATGGIGGVHREGENTMDVSADLVELGRTPVCVVSSGVKSILDIPRTLEFLETQGVCVSTFGSPGGCFPDFYTTDSGCNVPYNVDSPEEAAKLIQSLVDLELRSGMLIAVPVPAEHAMNKEEINEAIQMALLDAKAKRIEGKAVTPFLLAAITKLTQGKSLASNMALIRNNAKVAAQIAIAYSQSIALTPRTEVAGPPVVIGGSILDLSMTLQDDFNLDGATYDVKVKQSAGGDGRNLAEGIFKLYGSANFISAVGQDEIGKSLLRLIPEPLTSGIAQVPDRSTSLCSVIFDKFGDCKLIMGNMEIHGSISPELILDNEQSLSRTPLIVIDANLPLPTMETILTLADKHKRPVFFETTDMRIAAKPFTLAKELWQGIKFISPNLYELVEISKALTGHELKIPCDDYRELLPFAKRALESIHEHFHCILLTLGPHGVIVDRRKTKHLLDTLDDDVGRSIRFYPTEQITDLVNVSGAGDSFSSGFIANMLRGKSEEECIALGFFAAGKALQSDSAVPKEYFDNGSQPDGVTKWREL